MDGWFLWIGGFKKKEGGEFEFGWNGLEKVVGWSNGLVVWVREEMDLRVRFLYKNVIKENVKL